MEDVYELLQLTYNAWKIDYCGPYVNIWKEQPSPWTKEGGKCRIQMRVSKKCPFSTLYFLHSISRLSVMMAFVDHITEGCHSISDLARRMTSYLNHDTLACKPHVIDVRGKEECTQSPHIDYLCQKPTGGMTVGMQHNRAVRDVLLSNEFFLYPINFLACQASNASKYWTVLDLFWGYESYIKDHGDNVDTARHPYPNTQSFLAANTRHDEELKRMIYDPEPDFVHNPAGGVRPVAIAALQKLALMAEEEQLYGEAFVSSEVVFYVNMHDMSVVPYTATEFYDDKNLYEKEMLKFGLKFPTLSSASPED